MKLGRGVECGGKWELKSSGAARETAMRRR